MYKIFKKVLFTLDAEKAHNLIIIILKILGKIPGCLFLIKNKYLNYKNSTKNYVKIDNIIFKNKIGLAAGFDKNAEVFNELFAFGFSFIEVGAVTPKPQIGNPKPRLFRLKKDEAIINRMGFNNLGLKQIKKNLTNRSNKELIVGCNIGKNKLTLNKNAIDDYLKCFNELFFLVDYFSINVSSPNTPGLRELQQPTFLYDLLSKLQYQNNLYTIKKPIFLKISPDLQLKELDSIIETAIKTKITGLVVANTTISRPITLLETSLAKEVGGLSGKPINNLNNELIKYVKQKSNNKLKIIASGGILSLEDAKQKIDSGADLLQIYTGFIYKGPSLVKQLSQL